jgi:hypothetical protein
VSTAKDALAAKRQIGYSLCLMIHGASFADHAASNYPKNYPPTNPDRCGVIGRRRKVKFFFVSSSSFS